MNVQSAARKAPVQDGGSLLDGNPVDCWILDSHGGPLVPGSDLNDSYYVASVTVGVSTQTYDTTSRENALDWLAQMAEVAEKHGLPVTRYHLSRTPLSQVPQGDLWEDVTRDWHG